MIKIIAFFFLIFTYANLNAQTNKEDIIAFVGKKISLKKTKTPKHKPNYVMDTIVLFEKDTLITMVDLNQQPLKFYTEWDAKYEVQELINGKYFKKNIEFKVFDHYGKPEFSKFKNVLLFVQKSNGQFYLSTYQFFDVYKTKDGKWAGPYSSFLYNHPNNKDFTIKPEKINFKKKKIKIKRKNTDKNYPHELYPKPYYSNFKNYVVPIYGNSAKDLFELEFQILKSIDRYK